MSTVHHVERLSPHPQHSISLHHRKPLTLRWPVFINIGGRVEYVFIYILHNGTLDGTHDGTQNGTHDGTHDTNID